MNAIELHRPLVTMNAIVKVVGAEFGYTLTQFRSDRRAQPIARARQVVMYLAHELSVRNMKDIGRFLGGRDHTTIIHGIRRIEDLIGRDPDWAARVNKLHSAVLSLAVSTAGHDDDTEDLATVVRAARSLAIRRAKAVANLTIAAETWELRELLAGEFGETPVAAAGMKGGDEAELLLSPRGTWSLLQISRRSGQARLVASGDGWRPCVQPKKETAA